MTRVLYDLQDCAAFFEAQFLLGHRFPNRYMSDDHSTLLSYRWCEDDVRQALHVPLDAQWGECMLSLEMRGLAAFFTPISPVTYDEDGVEHEIPNWQDDPPEDWGYVSVYPQGVLQLATWYGRPYVRFGESSALLDHWRLVQEEHDARILDPLNAARFAQEWPERWVAWQAYNQKFWDEHGA